VGEPQLEVRDLSMHFSLRGGLVRRLRGQPSAVLRAVDGLDLELTRGEALGLVGESGCGKSTLGRCIVGLYTPTGGTIRYEGVELQASRDRAMRRRIQMVFQDPYSSLNPRMTVKQTLSELLRAHDMVPKAQIDARCRELLDLVGLGARSLDAYPRQFSGGQRQRVSIARALALEPELLVADEPVSALDVSVQATVLNLLDELRQKLGLTLLLIAHNMAVVRHVCDRVAVMYLGRIVETAPAGDLYNMPLHPYTEALLSAVPIPDPGAKRRRMVLEGEVPNPIRPPPGCHFHTRCPKAMPVCAVEAPLAKEMAPGHSVACHLY
jgi:oligopeptide transport system ATP-binding protein